MSFSSKEQLLISCTVAAIRNQQTLHEFKTFTEFLGCYEYILPSKRTLAFCFVDYLTQTCFSMQPTARDLFNAWLLADLVQCALTEEQQEEVVSRLSFREESF